MKLTYWVSDCLNDSSAYTIRAKTRKAAFAEREASGCPEDFGKPRKVVIHYKDALDLVKCVRSECGEGFPSLVDEE